MEEKTIENPPKMEEKITGNGNPSQMDVKTTGNLTKMEVKTTGNLSKMEEKTTGNGNPEKIEEKTTGNPAKIEEKTTGNPAKIEEKGTETPEEQMASKPLQISDTDSRNILNYWTCLYRKGEIPWHLDVSNRSLIKHMKKITGENFTDPKKFFLPMCGKTKDILFLQLFGHEIVGVEIVQKAVFDFGRENGLKFMTDSKDKTWRNIENGITIYVTDFLKAPLLDFGPFDCVWDRAAFAATSYEHREAYIEAIKRGLTDENGDLCDFRYLLQVVCYDKNLVTGPPYSVDEADMIKHFGDWTDFEVVERSTMVEDDPMRKWNQDLGDEAELVHYVLTPKL